MTLRLTRCVATTMSCVALASTLFILALQTPPLIASECCQSCEAKEAACYARCDAIPHEDGPNDSVLACEADCDYNLSARPSACWQNCSYCYPSNPYCYGATIEHFCYVWKTDDSGTYCIDVGHEPTFGPC